MNLRWDRIRDCYPINKTFKGIAFILHSGIDVRHAWVGVPLRYRYYSTVLGMIWYVGPGWTELDRTGPDRIASERTVPRYNRIPVNVLCAHAKHKTLSYSYILILYHNYNILLLLLYSMHKLTVSLTLDLDSESDLELRYMSDSKKVFSEF